MLPGEHGMDARNARRRNDVDAADAGMRVRRVEEDSIDLASEVNIGDIAGPTRQKARILLTGDGLSDAELHGVCLAPSLA